MNHKKELLRSLWVMLQCDPVALKHAASTQRMRMRTYGCTYMLDLGIIAAEL